MVLLIVPVWSHMKCVETAGRHAGAVGQYKCSSPVIMITRWLPTGLSPRLSALTLKLGFCLMSLCCCGAQQVQQHGRVLATVEAKCNLVKSELRISV